MPPLTLRRTAATDVVRPFKVANSPLHQPPARLKPRRYMFYFEAKASQLHSYSRSPKNAFNWTLTSSLTEPSPLTSVTMSNIKAAAAVT